MRSLGAVTLSAIVMCLFCAGVSAQDAEAPCLAPLNPAFADYIEGRPISVQSLDEDEYTTGLIPEPIKALFQQQSMLSALAVPPASYDLRTLDKLTPIKDQGNCGSCWAFATYGSLESFLKPTETWNFSENNLKNEHGFDISCCDGGNRSMSTAYLARWGGPIAEADDPYNTSSCSSPEGLTVRKHVQNVIYIPNRTGSLDNNALKQAVMTYGAVYTTFYYGSTYYRSSTRGYYYSGSNSSNHAVCIVGWNDNFPATSFNVTAPGNGAFLMRNSWGQYWGDGGYFWISYYDNKLGKTENAVFTAEPETNYDGVYQYDTLGWVSSVGFSSTSAWFANVFTSTAATKIHAAGWYFSTTNCTYQLYVYLSPTSGPISGGTLAAYKTGTLADAGYRTVALDSPVDVSAGQKFSIVVKLTTPGYIFPIPIERPYANYSSTARASAGQSYISSSGTSWSDITTYYSNTNCCLKAYVKAAGPAPGALSVTPATGLTSSGPEGGPFTPSQQAYTLTNTGGEPINWTAAKTQVWVSLSAVGGMLAPGDSTQVTVSINENADDLPQGDYSDTVSFTNTTNGQGNTTRSVDLTVTSSGPGELAVSPATDLVSSGYTGGPFSPSSQAYTLRNTGGASINWTAAKTQTWVTLSQSGGTLAPGASTGVTVSINSNANTLPAGAYSDTVTFTNTTNGIGSTTRAVSLAVNPGPDAYRVVKTTFAWISPTGHTNLNLKRGRVTAALAIPFSFDLYGITYNSVYVGAEGMVGFASSGMTSYYNTNIPKTTVPNKTLYGYWDDLDPSIGGTVTMGTVGSAPNRQVVFTWLNVPHHSQFSAKFSFQIIINEGTNDILFQYLNVAPTYSYGRGRSATIGIENETGTKACKWSYNTASLNNGDALLFTRTPAAPGQPNKHRR